MLIAALVCALLFLVCTDVADALAENSTRQKFVPWADVIASFFFYMAAILVVIYVLS